jgi:peptidoglycan/LPS O-acetylase OafA/YrhL
MKSGIFLLVLIGVYQLVLINLLNPGFLGIVFPENARLLAVPVFRSTLADWAIYFPLGVVLGMRARSWIPMSQRLMRVFAGLTLFIFILGLLDAFSVISFPVARFLCPLPLVLLLPGIKRENMRFVRPLERVGRRTYGIYLTHWIVLTLLLFVLESILPRIFALPILASITLFLLGAGIPIAIMESVAKSPAKHIYRSIFG